jgi:two-component system OmpR family sensor kinase
MARHFLQLYLLIVVTLAAVSWGQERLWEIYARRDANGALADNPEQAAALTLVAEQVRVLPPAQRPRFVADLARKTNVDLELFDAGDIAGGDVMERLERGEVALMNAANGQTWMLKRLPNDGRVLAFKYTTPGSGHGPFEWLLAILFYAAMALVIMIWLWPLTRDLQRLERSTTRFGDRNWTFDAGIGPRSQIFPLAQAFRRMAARIDSLISSHKEMSNAMSHEIKTPLARMRFEIEMARTAASPEKLAEHLHNINTDILELNAFVTATLDYAILERAEVALNMASQDFTLILPAVADSVRRSAREDLEIRCEVASDATRVTCDAHLMETVLRNLLYNAMRYARSQICITFDLRPDTGYALRVDDDGPGIPAADRERVFDSFVQLDKPSGAKVGFGLGLAIVKRVAQWHGGDVSVTQSVLGGASFCIHWPVTPAMAEHS